MIDSRPQASMEVDADELLNVHNAEDDIIREDDDDKMDADDAEAKPEVPTKSKEKNIEALLQKVNFLFK